MGLIYALLLILILSCVIGIIYIIYFNKLQDCKVKIDEAESIIDEALRAKYDTLIKTTNIIKSSIDDNKIARWTNISDAGLYQVEYTFLQSYRLHPLHHLLHKNIYHSFEV